MQLTQPGVVARAIRCDRHQPALRQPPERLCCRCIQLIGSRVECDLVELATNNCMHTYFIYAMRFMYPPAQANLRGFRAPTCNVVAVLACRPVRRNRSAGRRSRGDRHCAGPEALARAAWSVLQQRHARAVRRRARWRSACRRLRPQECADRLSVFLRTILAADAAGLGYELAQHLACADRL